VDESLGHLLSNKNEWVNIPCISGPTHDISVIRWTGHTKRKNRPAFCVVWGDQTPLNTFCFADCSCSRRVALRVRYVHWNSLVAPL